MVFQWFFLQVNYCYRCFFNGFFTFQPLVSMVFPMVFSIRDDGFSMSFYRWTIGIDGFFTVEPLVSMVFSMVIYRGNIGLDCFSMVCRKRAMVIIGPQKSTNCKKHDSQQEQRLKTSDRPTEPHVGVFNGGPYQQIQVTLGRSPLPSNWKWNTAYETKLLYLVY